MSDSGVRRLQGEMGCGMQGEMGCGTQGGRLRGAARDGTERIDDAMVRAKKVRPWHT